MASKRELFDKATELNLIPDGITYDEINLKGIKDLLKKDSNALVQIVPLIVGGVRIEFTKQKTLDSLIVKHPELEGRIEYIK